MRVCQDIADLEAMGSACAYTLCARNYTQVDGKHWWNSSNQRQGTICMKTRLPRGYRPPWSAWTMPWKLVSGEQKQNRFLGTFVPYPVRTPELISKIPIEVALGP